MKLVVVAVLIIAVAFAARVVLRCPAARPLPCHLFGKDCPVVRSSLGVVAPGWERVLKAHEELLRQGIDPGSQFAVFHKGELVVDIAGGSAIPWANREDAEPTPRRMIPDHLAPVFSSGKVAESLVVAVLADRGLLEYDAPISKYWPEFGAAGGGRELITVAQLMRHQAGLSAPPEPISPEVLGDDDAMRATLEEQPLNWVPDAGADQPRQVYHAITRGMFLAEVVRRVDPEGRTTSEFFADEVAKPLGINLTFGTRSKQVLDSGKVSFVSHSRLLLAKQVPQYFLPEWLSKDLVGDFDAIFPYESRRGIQTIKDIIHEGTFPPLWVRGLARVVNGANSVEEAQSPSLLLNDWLTSANAISNAHSLAKLASTLAAKGTHKGKSILTEKGYEAAVKGRGAAYDEVLGFDIAYSACGWGLNRFSFHNYTGMIGWAGASGSVIQWDPELELGMAFVPTLAYPRIARPRFLHLLKAVHRSLQGVRAGTVKSRFPMASEKTLELEEELKEKMKKTDQLKKMIDEAARAKAKAG
eukprot:Hpha_TRINITY_DN31068_c0_g1::TRINITY_DN31068_c0_g1_i1::g.64010::m.64010